MFVYKYRSSACTFMWGARGTSTTHISRSIRTVPVNVDLCIPTDSLSSKQSIAKTLKNPHTNILRMACRPQVISSVRAIGVRKKHQANTTITHVRSHTGLRVKASLGNSAADHLANWQVRQQTEGDHGTGEAHEAHNILTWPTSCHTAWLYPPGRRRIATGSRQRRSV